MFGLLFPSHCWGNPAWREINMASIRSVISALAVLAITGSAFAVPTNTTLPGGWSWQPIAGGSYNTGLVGTPRGGGNGQVAPPYTDTSFGIMNEPGAPWANGTDLSAQQYVQRQLFGNFGTNGAPGTRYFNFGGGGLAGPTFTAPGTAAGTNFSATTAERRNVTLNQWTNTNPDAGGIASLNQVVYVPVAATLTVGLGWGGDEMILRAIGGNNGGQTEVRIDANIDASFNTTAFGAISSTGNRINVNGITRFNDPGSLGNYDMPWGFGTALAAGQISLTRGFQDFVSVEGVTVGDPGQGATPNSVGYGFTNNYNVLSSILQNGSAFSVNFNAAAELFISRTAGGNADARAQLGPGFEGNVQLVVTYEAFRAVPTPGAASLLALGGLAAMRRRR